MQISIIFSLVQPGWQHTEGHGTASGQCNILSTPQTGEIFEHSGTLKFLAGRCWTV